MRIFYVCDNCDEEYEDKDSIYNCTECGDEMCEYCSDGLADELCYDCSKHLNEESESEE